MFLKIDVNGPETHEIFRSLLANTSLYDKKFPGTLPNSLLIPKEMLSNPSTPMASLKRWKMIFKLFSLNQALFYCCYSYL